MSVETQCSQNHSNSQTFTLTACAEAVKSAPLNLTQIHRKNGRKRSMPQKTVASAADEYGDDGSTSGDEFPDEQQPEEQQTEGANAEETKQNAKSILEHYRSFIQRTGNSNDPNGDVNKLDVKSPKLMKTSSTECKSGEENNWDYPTDRQNGEKAMIFDSIVNGPVNGPNGLIPERTMRQNNWAIKVWRDWALSRNRKPETKSERFPEAPVDIRVADLEVMSYWLPRFIKEVRRKDKKPYPPDTLMQIASGLQRYLRQVLCRSEVNFFDKYSNTFAEFRDALKSRSGELSLEAQANKSGKKIQVDNLSEDELWRSGYLDHTSAKGIFHIVFYYNCVEFEITSMEEHHELKVEQFQIVADPASDKEYIQFKRSDQRYYNMSTKQVMRHHASLTDHRCLVKLYKAYLNLVPSTGPFYRRPLQTPENSSPRFSFNPVGINKLRETHKQLFSPDRPASLRQSGKTTTIRHVAGNSNDDDDHPSSPPSAVTSNQPISASQAVYGALARSLQLGGQLRYPIENVVDLSVKTNGVGADSEEESVAATSGVAASGVANVIEQLRRNWQSMKSNERHDVTNSDDDVTADDDGADDDDDQVLTLKVPLSVKYVIVEREGKRLKFSLD